MFCVEYIQIIDGTRINKISPDFETLEECYFFIKNTISYDNTKFYQRIVKLN